MPAILINQTLWQRFLRRTFQTFLRALCRRRKKKPAKFSPRKKPFASVCRPSRPQRRQSSCPHCRPAGQPARAPHRPLQLPRRLCLAQLAQLPRHHEPPHRQRHRFYVLLLLPRQRSARWIKFLLLPQLWRQCSRSVLSFG
jgi:hypothetical protein